MSKWMEAMDLIKYLEANTTVYERYGDEYVISCPHCDTSDTEKHHLWVNVEKSIGVCYRCGDRAFDLVDIVRAVEKCTLSEALSVIRDEEKPSSRLRKVVESLDPSTDIDMPTDDKTSLVELPPAFRPIESKRGMPAYARSRGLDAKTCRRYGIGWCDAGYYQYRLIVPVYDTSGDLATFIARFMGSERSRGGRPKVLYPKGSRKSKVLFNQEIASRSDTIVVTEGVFDALRVGDNAVALLGKKASKAQLELLIDLSDGRTIVVMLDSDAMADARELAEELSATCDRVYVAKLPRGRKDPGECTRREIMSAIKRASQHRDWKSALQRVARVV